MILPVNQSKCYSHNSSVCLEGTTENTEGFFFRNKEAQWEARDAKDNVINNVVRKSRDIKHGC